MVTRLIYNTSLTIDDLKLMTFTFFPIVVWGEVDMIGVVRNVRHEIL